MYDAKWNPNARTIAGTGQFGSSFDELHCPQGLCINKNQTILIADSSNHRIMKYKRGKRTGTKIAGKNINEYSRSRLNGPSNVIYDINSNSFIIGDCHNERVLRWFPGNTTYSETIKKNIKCYGLAMDHEGDIYISYTEKHEVRRYRKDDKCGTVVAGGYGEGERLNQLNHPTYIFVDRSQSVYVSDSWNDRVMKWEKSAKEGIIVAGGNGQGNNLTQLNCPAGVIVDKLDTVYVADHGNHRVMRWYKGKPHGDIIVGDKDLPGNSAKHLYGPGGLLFDREGNLYVADSYNHRVQRFAIEKN